MYTPTLEVVEEEDCVQEVEVVVVWQCALFAASDLSRDRAHPMRVMSSPCMVGNTVQYTPDGLSIMDIVPVVPSSALITGT